MESIWQRNNGVAYRDRTGRDRLRERATRVTSKPTQPRERVRTFDDVADAPLHIALAQPEIPPNTGNVARLCAATGCALHLIEPLGFSIDDRELKRAGLDYWHALGVVLHESLDAFLGDDRRAFALVLFGARVAARIRRRRSRAATCWYSDAKPKVCRAASSRANPLARCASRCARTACAASTSRPPSAS